MCQVSYDSDGPSHWSETTRKARKRHRCEACGGSIEAGDVYAIFFWVDGREASSAKECPACYRVAKEYEAEHAFMWFPDGLREALAACAEDDEKPEYDEAADEFKPSAQARKWLGYIDEMDARGKAATATTTRSTT